MQLICPSESLTIGGMSTGKLVFSQITELIHPQQFERCMARYPTKRQPRGLSAWDLFLSLCFAQLTYRESLRDIEACLHGNSYLYAMGIRGNPTRTNLAYGLKHRDWRAFADLGQLLIGKCRRLHAQTQGPLELDELVYALDSTTIDLCLNLFPWADFRSTKAAIKLHTLMDLRGSIPVFISITSGSVHDVNILDKILPQPGAIYVMDRGYVDFARLYRLHQSRAFFVTRAKSNMAYRVVRSTPVDKSTGVLCDQSIKLKVPKSQREYPGTLRRIRYRDPETGQILVFLTNNLEMTSLMVAAIYKSRWHIELFFKWIKQNLRIKSFYGRTPNAVKVQIWSAICVYLLVNCLKISHDIPENLSRILQVLSINPFQNKPLPELLTNNIRNNEDDSDFNQLIFNGF